MQYEFVQDNFFNQDKVDLHKDWSGLNYVLTLYMKWQDINGRFASKLAINLSMICAFSYTITIIVLDYLNPEGEGRKELGWGTENSRSQQFWISLLVSNLPLMAFTMMMFMFFDFAISDAVRRNTIMTYLSHALEINLHKKDPITL